MRKTFLGRPLRWKRNAHSASSSIDSDHAASPFYARIDGMTTDPNTQSVYSPTEWIFDQARAATESASRPPSSNRLSQMFPFTRPPSLVRAHSPTMAAPLPGFSFAAPDLPSPALTDVSSHNAPEGLLHPRLGVLRADAMQSNGAISFRDDMDYSRPIGAVSPSLSLAAFRS